MFFFFFINSCKSFSSQDLWRAGPGRFPLSCLTARVYEKREAGWYYDTRMHLIVTPASLPQHERLQRANTFRDRQRANLAVILLDSNKPPVWTRTWSQLNACYSTKHISFSTRRVEDIDLSTVTLVIEILHHWQTFQLVVVKTSWHPLECRLKRGHC